MSSLRTQVCQLVKDLQVSATQNATNKVNEILNVSANYMSEANHEKLKVFHDLYFAEKQELETQKSVINAQVVDIFDQATAMLSSNKSEAEIVKSIKTNDAADQERLQLSGLQKKLEALISFEDGLRDSLAPVMSSMQFEDATRQRIEHIVAMFSMIVENNLVRNPENASSIVDSLAAQISIQHERESFYRLVLHEQAPAHVESESFFL
jgi:ATP-dependent 26S proteasome regulatory subunit